MSLTCSWGGVTVENEAWGCRKSRQDCRYSAVAAETPGEFRYPEIELPQIASF